MAAIQRARARQCHAAVLSVGSAYVGAGGDTVVSFRATRTDGAPQVPVGAPSLSPDDWAVVLDALAAETEAYAQSCAGPGGAVAVEGCVLVARHYHAVHAACAAVLPLPRWRWEQWLRGLEQLREAGLRVGTACGGDDAGSAAGARVEAEHAVLCAEYADAFEAAFIGCGCAVRSALGRVVASLGTGAAAPGDGGVVTGRLETLADVRRAYGPALHAFQRLCFESSHLFDDYGSVGACEREWLQRVLLAGGAPVLTDEAYEAAVRWTYRRDARVAHAGLGGALLASYGEFEVDERKAKEVRRLVAATAGSAWQGAAAALWGQVRAASAGGVAGDGPAPDAAWHEAADALVGCFLGPGAGRPAGVARPPRSGSDDDGGDSDGASAAASPPAAVSAPNENGFINSPEARALHLTLWRIAEGEAYPAVVNPARLQFCLVLVQKLVGAYLHERNHGDLPLFEAGVAGDGGAAEEVDAPLWGYLLRVHGQLLKWAVATCATLASTPTTTTTGPASDAAYRLAIVEAVRAVSLSVVHCWQAYLADLGGRLRHAGRWGPRARHATEVVRGWLDGVAVRRYLQGLYVTTGPGRGGSGDDGVGLDDYVAASAALLAAQLLALAHPAVDRRDVGGAWRARLRSYLGDALLGALDRLEGGEPAADDSAGGDARRQQLFEVAMAAASLCQRCVLCTYGGVADGGGVSKRVDADTLVSLQQQYRRLLRVAPSADGAARVANALIEMEVAAGGSQVGGGEAALPGDALASYAQRAVGRPAGPRRGRSLALTLADVVADSRRAIKRLRAPSG